MTAAPASGPRLKRRELLTLAALTTLPAACGREPAAAETAAPPVGLQAAPPVSSIAPAATVTASAPASPSPSASASAFAKAAPENQKDAVKT